MNPKPTIKSLTAALQEATREIDSLRAELKRAQMTEQQGRWSAALKVGNHFGVEMILDTIVAKQSYADAIDFCTDVMDAILASIGSDNTTVQTFVDWAERRAILSAHHNAKIKADALRPEMMDAATAPTSLATHQEFNGLTSLEKKLTRNGQRIFAIKLLRDRCALDLRRAKDLVEEYARSVMNISWENGHDIQLPEDAKRWADGGVVINAIKVLREYYPRLGLKEAKDCVDFYCGRALNAPNIHYGKPAQPVLFQWTDNYGGPNQ